jgi:hypothetical protein
VSVRGAFDPWLSGIALLVLAVVGLAIRRRFEAREDEGPPPAGPGARAPDSDPGAGAPRPPDPSAAKETRPPG